MFLEKKVDELLKDISSSSPTPGGGSVSALVGSIAACLSIMVANLTIGKKKYIEVQDEIQKLKSEIVFKLDNLVNAYEEDSKAFDLVMSAFKLPKGTPEEEKIRNEEIEKATEKATSAPLNLIKLIREIIDYAARIGTIGNKNSLSDAGVSLILLKAAAEGALLNVLINTQSLSDRERASLFNSDAKKTFAEIETIVNSNIYNIKNELSK